MIEKTFHCTKCGKEKTIFMKHSQNPPECCGWQMMWRPMVGYGGINVKNGTKKNMAEYRVGK